jgi:SAM-dependent methyltransferase
MSFLEQPQSSYIGRHAELYDLFYADKPYEKEAEFVHSCLQKYSTAPVRRILELACGTGAHSFLLEKKGYEVIATDYSGDMLNQARAKAEAAGSRVDFRRQDMRSLDVPERPFDAVICLFDSIGYVATNENIRRVFSNVHAHLQEGGLFIFEFWHAGAMIRGYDPLRVRHFQAPQGEIVRISETQIDYKEQLCHVSYTIIEMNANGTHQTLCETQINRFFLVQEMAFFLENANLSPLKWYAGFHDDEQIDQNIWHIVAVARKGVKG